MTVCVSVTVAEEVLTGELQIYDISATPATPEEYFTLKARVKNILGKETSFDIAVYWVYEDLIEDFYNQGYTDEDIPMYILPTTNFEDKQNIKTVTLTVGEETEVTFRPGFGKKAKLRMAIALYAKDKINLAYGCATSYTYEYTE